MKERKCAHLRCKSSHRYIHPRFYHTNFCTDIIFLLLAAMEERFYAQLNQDLFRCNSSPPRTMLPFESLQKLCPIRLAFNCRIAFKHHWSAATFLTSVLIVWGVSFIGSATGETPQTLDPAVMNSSKCQQLTHYCDEVVQACAVATVDENSAMNTAAATRCANLLMACGILQGKACNSTSTGLQEMGPSRQDKVIK